MSFKILYVTATSVEAEALRRIKGLIPVSGGYRSGNCEITLLITGVGSIATAWALKQWISENKKPDLALNAGIAGSYNDEYRIGDVVMPLSDCFADAGIEDNGAFLTLSEAGLCDADEFPFRKGLLYSDNMFNDRMKSLIKPVRAVTVNTATGSAGTRDKLLKKFNADIETMEGATFFYICARENIPFLALRAISNKVELRDRSKWNISLAIDNLSEKLNEIILIPK
ncbi:MAG: futalosine hydrolase [Bacteroidales bacterium]|nr:futalosine hydrolase [Bacteroidales bacterium]